MGNQKIGKYGILGVGDYTKTWILDSKHVYDKTMFEVGKTIDFDLNILTYLNKIMNGHKANINVHDFISYLNYIKKEGFQIGITTALMERAATPICSEILCEMITSFVKFDNIQMVDENMENIYLPPQAYEWMKQIYDMAIESAGENIDRYNLTCCCIMKAFLIKTYDVESNKNKKVEKFIEYCLNRLNCYAEKEIVILSLYIMDDSRTHRTFKKLKKDPDIIKNIANVAWDIFHIRLIEEMLFNDNKKNDERVILPYFGTADSGLIDAMQINPIRAFVIMKGHSIPVHQTNIEDICTNVELIENVHSNAGARDIKAKNLDFKKIRDQLEDEILEKINS